MSIGCIVTVHTVDAVSVVIWTGRIIGASLAQGEHRDKIHFRVRWTHVYPEMKEKEEEHCFPFPLSRCFMRCVVKSKGIGRVEWEVTGSSGWCMMDERVNWWLCVSLSPVRVMHPCPRESALCLPVYSCSLKWRRWQNVKWVPCCCVCFLLSFWRTASCLWGGRERERSIKSIKNIDEWSVQCSWWMVVSIVSSKAIESEASEGSAACTRVHACVTLQSLFTLPVVWILKSISGPKKERKKQRDKWQEGTDKVASCMTRGAIDSSATATTSV